MTKEASKKKPGTLLKHMDLDALHHPRSTYTAEQKVAACMAYILTGTSFRAETLCGVPAGIIRDWKQSDWWDETSEACRREKQEELDGVMTNIIHEAIEKVRERVQLGELIYIEGEPAVDPDSPDGFAHKPLSLRELTITLGILYDKRNLIRGDPTSISGKTDTSTKMQELTDEFKKLSKEIKGKKPIIVGEATVVEGEGVVVDAS